MQITGYDLRAIYWEAEPVASQSFERLAADHGRQFAERLREDLLAQKQIDMNHEYANGCGRCPRPANTEPDNLRISECKAKGQCGCVFSTIE